MEGNRVLGVQAVSGAKSVRIRTRQAVLFGTGGYAHNVEMVALHQPSLRGACARAGSTGDFLKIAGTVGAAMGTLGTAWRSQVLLEEALENRAVGLGVFYLPGDSMLVVNKYGRRVLNEKRNYNDRTRVHFEFDPTEVEYPNDLLFMIFDQRTLTSFAGSFPLPTDPREQPYLIKGDTWEQLAAAVSDRLRKCAASTGGVSLGQGFLTTLAGTVSTFNSYAKTGVDPDFGRGKHQYDHGYGHYFSPMKPSARFPANPLPNELLYPISSTGPYYAFILAAGALDTSGGPATNERAQVLDVRDEPIRGLYGAGNCIASPTGSAYYGGGCTLGPAVTFGYIAAMNALQETTA
jgi:hypothetical protein